MTLCLGNVPAGSTLYIPFSTYGTDGASISMTGLAVTDIEVYKDGSTTQRASDAGFALLDTDGIDFDGITGLHGISINLADNTTANFYAVGSQYWVVISAVTVDSLTVSFIAAVFRIVAAEDVAGHPKVDMDYIQGVEADGVTTPDVNVATIATDAISAASVSAAAVTKVQNGLALTAATASASALSAVALELTSVQDDVTAILTDLANGGRLDLILDAILADATLARQILGNKHTVVESPAGTFTISVRNDADDATVRTIVYIPATGARTVS